MIIGHLHITSWRGISIGAVHYYAELIVEDKHKKIERLELERKMTAKEVAVANKEFAERGYEGVRYYVGDKTEGFNTEAQAIKFGINYFKRKYPEGILFKGDHCTCSAWKNVIYYPPQHKQIVDALEFFAIEFQKMNGYECVPALEPIVSKLDEEWYKLFSHLTDL